jgi:hypothetical protein
VGGRKEGKRKEGGREGKKEGGRKVRLSYRGGVDLKCPQQEN